MSFNDMSFNEWYAEEERLGLEEFENWSRHTMVVPVVTPQPDPELNFPCDVCGKGPGEKCAENCEYRRLKEKIAS